MKWFKMFRKTCKVKSNTQLKASDRKKLLQEVSSQLHTLSEKEIDIILPTKEAVCSIKLLTSSGKLVTVYSVQKCPILFELEKELFPTVYLLWRVPHIIPTLTTVDLVAQKISDGADLMIPGVVVADENSPDCYGNLQKGDRVAINTVRNKAACAVGKSATSSQKMYELKRGKCVEVLHTFNDKLCTLESNALKFPEFGSTISREKLNIVTEAGSADNAEPKSEDKEERITAFLEGKEDEYLLHNLNRVGISEEPSPTETQSRHEKYDMDELLMNSFLKCLTTDMKKTSLPILANLFYKNHVLEASPPGVALDIRKTKYKKLSEFLNQMENVGVITLDSFTKGVLSITAINFKHEIIQEYLKLHPQKVESKPPNIKNGPDISERYTVNAFVLPIFSKFMYKKGDCVTVSDVRRVITSYVKNENLQLVDCSQKVILNPVLSSIMNSKNESVSWEELMNTVIQKMGHCYQIELKGNEVINAKGKLKPIEVTVATRAGSKKVTLISNLELYGVNIQEFCRECQHGVAASTTTNNLPGAKSIQVQVQGNQVVFISKLLTGKYQIPKRYIRGLDDGSSAKSKSK